MNTGLASHLSGKALPPIHPIVAPLWNRTRFMRLMRPPQIPTCPPAICSQRRIRTYHEISVKLTLPQGVLSIISQRLPIPPLDCFDFTLQSLSRFVRTFLPDGDSFCDTYIVKNNPIGYHWHVIHHFNTKPPCCSS